MGISKPIHRLKRDAKILSRETGLPLHKALERMAQTEGYPNWGLLMDKNSKQPQGPKITDRGIMITKLPLEPEDRLEFIELANSTFEMAMRRMEPDNPELTRELWDVEEYVDVHAVQEDMLPIDKDYALSLIEAFLWHHVVDLAVAADKTALETSD